MNRNRGKDISYEINDNGCWECTSHRKDRNGYPSIYVNNKNHIMSRYIYERFNGDIPLGYVIRHKCDNGSCINPSHLETGTCLDNIHDKVIRNRTARQCGETNGASKLTQNQVDKIRIDTREQKFIAKEYKVSTRQIRNIKSNKSWCIL